MARTAKTKPSTASSDKKLNPHGAVTLALKSKLVWFNRQAKRFGMTKKAFVLAACEEYVKNHKPLFESK